MTKVLREDGNGAELVLTSDKVNPFGLRIDDTVVVQSWSLVLMEKLLDNRSFLAEAESELDKL